jgi:predicted ribosomally synthesized peptide with SipW-like signal peptide
MKNWLNKLGTYKTITKDLLSKKWPAILISLTVLAAMVGIGAYGWFSDVETSNNTFVAGSLDLSLDGNNGTNVVKWSVGPMVPGSHPKGTFVLANNGTIAGYLDLENITVSNLENGIIEPEAVAGDNTDSEGELVNIVDLQLFQDLNCDGLFDPDDIEFFNGKVGTVASSFDLNIPMSSGETICISGIFDWWSSPDDNMAMTDSFNLDITFELGQRPEQ